MKVIKIKRKIKKKKETKRGTTTINTLSRDRAYTRRSRDQIFQYKF
jgi:hypothetical protein